MLTRWPFWSAKVSVMSLRASCPIACFSCERFHCLSPGLHSSFLTLFVVPSGMNSTPSPAWFFIASPTHLVALYQTSTAYNPTYPLFWCCNYSAALNRYPDCLFLFLLCSLTPRSSLYSISYSLPPVSHTLSLADLFQVQMYSWYSDLLRYYALCGLHCHSFGVALQVSPWQFMQVQCFQNDVGAYFERGTPGYQYQTNQTGIEHITSCRQYSTGEEGVSNETNFVHFTGLLQWPRREVKYYYYPLSLSLPPPPPLQKKKTRLLCIAQHNTRMQCVFSFLVSLKLHGWEKSMSRKNAEERNLKIWSTEDRQPRCTQCVSSFTWCKQTLVCGYINFLFILFDLTRYVYNKYPSLSIYQLEKAEAV